MDKLDQREGSNNNKQKGYVVQQMSSYLMVGHVPELHILHIASTITVTVLQNNTIGIQGWMDV